MKGEANQSSLLPSSSTVCSAARPIAMVDDAGPVAVLQQGESHRLRARASSASATTITALGTVLMKKMLCQP